MLDRFELLTSSTLVLSDAGPIITTPEDTDAYQSLPAFSDGVRVKILASIGDLDVASTTKPQDRSVLAERLFTAVERSEEAYFNFFLVGTDAGPTEFTAALRGQVLDLPTICGLESIGDLAVDRENQVVIVGGPDAVTGFPNLVVINSNATVLGRFPLGESGALEWSTASLGNIYSIVISDDGQFTSRARWAGGYLWQNLEFPASRVYTAPNGNPVFRGLEGKVAELESDEAGFGFEAILTLEEGEELACLYEEGLVLTKGNEFKLVSYDWPATDVGE